MRSARPGAFRCPWMLRGRYLLMFLTVVGADGGACVAPLRMGAAGHALAGGQEPCFFNANAAPQQLRGGAGGGQGDDCLQGDSGAECNTATFENVALLVLEPRAERVGMWRERGRGTLQLRGLTAGEPRVALFAPADGSLGNSGGVAASDSLGANAAAWQRSACDDDDDDVRGRPAEAAAGCVAGATPMASHALWEFMDEQRLVGELSSCVSCELPAGRANALRGITPDHERAVLLAWRFSSDAAVDSFLECLIRVRARLRGERLEVVSKLRAARRGKSERDHAGDGEVVLQQTESVGEHGLSARQVADMLDAEGRVLDDDSCAEHQVGGCEEGVAAPRAACSPPRPRVAWVVGERGRGSAGGGACDNVCVCVCV